jgi:hypothetical protein
MLVEGERLEHHEKKIASRVKEPNLKERPVPKVDTSA